MLKEFKRREELIHISCIQIGDTIEHNKKIVTVCKKDIKRGGFHGTSVFGDSYRGGTIKVKRISPISSLVLSH